MFETAVYQKTNDIHVYTLLILELLLLMVQPVLIIFNVLSVTRYVSHICIHTTVHNKYKVASFFIFPHEIREIATERDMFQTRWS